MKLNTVLSVLLYLRAAVCKLENPTHFNTAAGNQRKYSSPRCFLMLELFNRGGIGGIYRSSCASIGHQNSVRADIRRVRSEHFCPENVEESRNYAISGLFAMY